MKKPRFISIPSFLRLRVLKSRRVLTSLAALLVLTIAASAFVLVRSRAAGERFPWPTSLNKIFGSESARAKSVEAAPLSPPAPMPVVATYYSQGSVDPSVLTNWNTVRAGGGISPVSFTNAGDTFVIQDTHNMATTATWSFGASGSKLEIESGGILTASNAVTIQSSTTFQIDGGGTYLHNNTTAYGSSIFNGVESFAATSTVILNNSNTTGPSSVAFGNLTVNFTSDPGGFVNCGGGVTTINGNLSIVNTSIREFRLAASSPSSLTTTIGGDLAISGGILNLTSGSTFLTLNVGGNFNQSGGTFESLGGAAGVNFTGTSKTFTQSAGNLINGNVIWQVNSGASLTLANNLPVASNRVFTVNGTLDCATNAVTGGTFTLASGATLQIGSTAGITSSGATGNIQTTTRNFSIGASYVYNGSNSQAVGNGLPSSVTNLTIANTGGGGSNTVTGNSGQTVTGLLRVQSGVYAGASTYNNVQIDSGATLALAGATSVSGNWTNNGTFTHNGFGVTFNGSSAQAITGSSTTSFSSLTDSNTSAAVSSSVNFNVSGTLNMNGAGTLMTLDPVVQINSAGNTGTITGTGTVQVTRISSNPFSNQYRFSTNTLSALTVDWAGAGDQTIENGVASYGGLKTSGSGTKTIGGSGTLPINGNVTIGTGTVLSQGANSLTVAGSWSNSGSFTPGLLAVTVTFNGAATTQTISGTNNFSNLTINHTGAGSVTAASSTLAVTGLLRVQAGAFTSASDYHDVTIDSGAELALSGPITVSGNWINNGTFTPNGFGVTFDGTGAQLITTGGTGTGKTFAAFTTNKSSGTATLAGDLLATSLNVIAGTVDQGASFNVTPGPVTVGAAGIWSNTGTGDLTLSGGVSNAGTITFNGNGTSCPEADDIVIASTGGQQAWSGAGTFNLTDVAVSNQGGTALITVHNGTDGGGNGLNWVFLASCTGNAYTWVGGTPGTPTDWTVAANWSPARVAPDPSGGDVLTFNTSATVTNVAGAVAGTNETISALHITNSATPTFSTGGANILTINAGAGNTGFDVYALAITGSNR